MPPDRVGTRHPGRLRHVQAAPLRSCGRSRPASGTGRQRVGRFGPEPPHEAVVRRERVSDARTRDRNCVVLERCHRARSRLALPKAARELRTQVPWCGTSVPLANPKARDLPEQDTPQRSNIDPQPRAAGRTTRKPAFLLRLPGWLLLRNAERQLAAENT